MQVFGQKILLPSFVSLLTINPYICSFNCVCVCTHVYVHVYILRLFMPRYIYGSQETTSDSQFSSSTMWDLGIELSQTQIVRFGSKFHHPLGRSSC